MFNTSYRERSCAPPISSEREKERESDREREREAEGEEGVIDLQS